ncbi:glycosyltransferase [Desulfovibrio mangrovi]|uniref:glycosyltransferase n=1 Tax=Desulfovibrio mangrovi TaxID=2976983 RepID=UPI002247CA6B|nr:glycosyltransferase [Desulfovibrio mangrovi]UZP66895.1 glycosyltransferase [Desulfovibrio mangrovi]
MSDMDDIKAEAMAREAARLLAQKDLRMAETLVAKALTFAPQHPEALKMQQAVLSLRSPGYSVIIPTCNRLDILKQCLRCLEEQTMPHADFEVVVVDDASTDGTAEFLAEYRPPFAFRSIIQPRRGGPAKARNAGIRVARGEFVHFLNDDAMIEPHVLQLHSMLHSALPDKSVSILGGFSFGPPFTETLWGYALEHGDLLFRYPTFAHNGLHGHRSYYSCNISTPRRSLIQVGLFDEEIAGNLWGAEDMELGKRLEASSVPVLYREDSRSTHVHDVGVEGLARTAYVRGGGAVWMFAKHGERPHYARLGAHDIAFWRNLPPRLVRRMGQLHEVLARTEHVRPVPDDNPAPYLRRENYAAMLAVCRSLWHMRTRELLLLIDEVEKLALQVLEDVAQGKSMQFCAARLYPAMLFIRFYHDTIGVCASDAIRHYCPEAPPIEAENATAEPVPFEGESGDGATDAGAFAGQKVLLACNFFWPSVGGTELLIEELGLQLQQLGYHVEVACRWLENRSASTRLGMPIHSFRCHGKFTDSHMGPDTEKYRTLVCKGGYDAIIVLAHPDNWTCHLLRDLPSPHPRIIMMPSINSDNIEHWKGMGVMDTIAGTLRAAGMCVAVSEQGYDRRLFAELGVPHVFIPHAVNPDPDTRDMRTLLEVPSGSPLLACVGNFWPVKNQLELVKRFAAEPLDVARNWRLVLAGAALPWERESRYFEECWAIADSDPRIRILGPLPPRQATALIRDADMLLVPSLGESAGPLVVLEAMALSVPWIATPQCNAVYDEGGGIITELDSFPQAVQRLLEQPDLARELGRNGREHWERCFRWDSVAPVFDALLKGVPVAGSAMPEVLRVQQAELVRRLLPESGRG